VLQTGDGEQAKGELVILVLWLSQRATVINIEQPVNTGVKVTDDIYIQCRPRPIVQSQKKTN